MTGSNPGSGASVIRSPLLQLAGHAESPGVRNLLTELLREQQTLTAVERFSRQHDDSALSLKARTYSDLIPTGMPGAGRQYAFEVNLDACTGCKACVAACHNLNGLEDSEIWRTVGVLHGGTPEAPAQQTVTTACHHCVDPACMTGCPVSAYEKDPATGIVRHLDDQCIGCQYCTLMCPYDAPKYSHAKGIVRKCDMCSDRLTSGEAPACVQGCPNGAIAIRIIDQARAIQASESGAFLAGAPAPDHTVPTTMYQTARPAPQNMLPADYYSVSPESDHPPLVIMMVLTQLAVGAFAFDVLFDRIFGAAFAEGWGFLNAAVALVLAVGALGAATLHLGRPQYAFRAVLGLRTSWMSREILAFGGFAGLGALYAASLAPWGLRTLTGDAVALRIGAVAGVGAVVLGLAGVACSAMIYAATRRSHWRGAVTGPRFLATTVLLGAAAVHTVSTVGARIGGSHANGPTALRWLLAIIIISSAAKLLTEAVVFRHLRSLRHSVGKRVALVMKRDLRSTTQARFVLGGVGGLGIPALTVTAALPGPDLAANWVPSTAFIVSSVLILLSLVAGELLERSLFFRAAPPSRMPGAFR